MSRPRSLVPPTAVCPLCAGLVLCQEAVEADIQKAVRDRRSLCRCGVGLRVKAPQGTRE